VDKPEAATLRKKSSRISGKGSFLCSIGLPRVVQTIFFDFAIKQTEISFLLVFNFVIVVIIPVGINKINELPIRY
jgi:hypothetical protein